MIDTIFEAIKLILVGWFGVMWIGVGLALAEDIHNRKRTPLKCLAVIPFFGGFILYGIFHWKPLVKFLNWMNKEF